MQVIKEANVLAATNQFMGCSNPDCERGRFRTILMTAIVSNSYLCQQDYMGMADSCVDISYLYTREVSHWFLELAISSYQQVLRLRGSSCLMWQLP